MMGKDIFIWLIVLVFAFVSCSESSHQPKSEISSNETIHISVDESFRPVIEQELQVFQQSFPNAHIITHYKSEDECFRDFFQDTTNRLILVSRPPTDDEIIQIKDSLGYPPGFQLVAVDGVAVIINENSTDTVFTKEQLSEELTGKRKTNRLYVFDGIQATANNRFISDSLLKGAEFDTSKVKAVENPLELIKYIGSHKDAVGFLGTGWLHASTDTAVVNAIGKIKTAYIQCTYCNDQPYVRPVYESINFGRYPLRRGLYYIIKENYKGVGTNFISFLKYERGQLIFHYAHMGTAMDFDIRRVKINKSL